jgi:hypothetical protein
MEDLIIRLALLAVVAIGLFISLLCSLNQYLYQEGSLSFDVQEGHAQNLNSPYIIQL